MQNYLPGKTALVVGATGLTGKNVVNELLKNPFYEKVISLVRSPAEIQHPKLEQRVTDFENLLPWKEKVDEVFCCLGTTIRKAGSKRGFYKVDYWYPYQIALIAKELNVTRFLLISSMGANKDSKIFYNRVKGKLEETLKELHFNSLLIFRPSLILGEREELRPGETIAKWISLIFSPLMVGAMNKYRPIQARKIAKAMVYNALKNFRGIHVFESDKLHAF